MELPLISQDPDEVLDYAKDWDLELEGDTINTSVWSITPTGPMLTNPTGAGSIRTCTVEALTGARVYTLRNRITTAGGRTYVSEWFIWGESR
jgi:hypothetical protein